MGDKTCPAGTVGGCAVDTCMPNQCEEGKYPFYDAKSGAQCVACPSNCADGCEQDGTCKGKGCIVGFWGPQCDTACPEGCDGACDKEGKCKQCKDGLTGAECDKSCHKTCQTCTQYKSGVGGLLGAAGNNAD